MLRQLHVVGCLFGKYLIPENTRGYAARLGADSPQKARVAGVNASERGKKKKAGSLQSSLLKVVEPILTLYPEPEKPCFLWKVDFSITSDVSTKDDPTAFF